MNRDHSQKDISELEFRIKFREEYGIDYLDAVDIVKRTRERTELEWNQLLIKYKLI